MIVASHESINGDYTKLKDMFKNNSNIISEEEKLEYTNIYCTKELIDMISQEKIQRTIKLLIKWLLT